MPPAPAPTLRSLPGRSRAGLLVLLAAALVAVTAETLPTGLLPQIAGGLGTSTGRTAALVGVYALVVAVGAVPLTVLTARLPRRPLLVATLVGYAVGNALLALTNSFAVALGARVLGGLAHALFFAVAAAYAARLVPRALAGRAVAVAMTGSSLGLMAGLPGMTALGIAVGWRTAFGTLAVADVVLVAVALRLLPAVAATPGTGRRAALRVVRSPGLVVVGLVCAVVYAGHYTAYTFVSPLLVRGGLAPGQVGAGLFVYGLAGFGGVVVAGVGSDRWPRTLLVGAVGALTAVLVLLWAAPGTVVLTLVALAGWGVAFGSVPAVTMTGGLRAGAREPDVAAAVVNATSNAGIAVGSTLGAATLARAGLVGVPAVAAVVVLAALAVTLAGRRWLALPSPAAPPAEVPLAVPDRAATADR